MTLIDTIKHLNGVGGKHKAQDIKTTSGLTVQEQLDAIGSPLLFVGSIGLASDFPLLADVKNGWTYKITADVIDNDPTKTNTGQSFKIGDVVSWNGTDWTDITGIEVFIDDGTDVKTINSRNIDLQDKGLKNVGVTKYTTPGTAPTSEGSVYWEDNKLNIVHGNGVIQQVGLEDFKEGRNNTGSLIANGTVVYATGGVGASENITIATYIADRTILNNYLIGIATQDIANGETGYLTTDGKVRGVDTSAYTEGDILYVSPITAGGLTNVKPSYPDQIIPIAYVLSVGTNGVLEVRTPTSIQDADETYYNGTESVKDKLDKSQDKLSEGAFQDGDKTKLDNIEPGATADQTAGEIKSLYESNADTNALTDNLKTLLETKKVKDVSLDAVNNRAIITYTDDTTASLNVNDIVTDVNVTGATLDATSNVLTLTSDDGGADVTVDLSDFVNSSEFTSALNTKVTKVTSTDNAIVRFNGTTGDIQNSTATISDSGIATLYNRLDLNPSSGSLEGGQLNINGVGSDLAWSIDTDSEDSLRLFTTSKGNSNITLGHYVAGTGSVIIKTNNVDRMKIDGEGRVGIGTVEPAGKMHIYNTDETVPALLIENNNNGGPGLEITAHNLSAETDLVFNGNAVIGTENSINFTASNINGFYAWYNNIDSNRTGITGGTELMLLGNNGLLINEYTQLGTGAPKIRQVKLTGTTGANQGDQVIISHGLDGSKILDYKVLVEYATDSNIGAGITADYRVGSEFNTWQGTNGFVIKTSPTNSANILSKPIKILVTYEQ